MARAYGANASLLAAFETTYGSNPVGDYWKLPFVSTTLGSEQGLIANDLIGLGRDPSAPIRDVIKVEGDIVVPIDVRHIGIWLKALLGEAATSGTDVVTHTFTSWWSNQIFLPFPLCLQLALVVLNQSHPLLLALLAWQPAHRSLDRVGKMN